MPFALADESFTVALLCGVWLTEKLFERRLGMSPILGQLCAGVLLGPPLANAVPFVPALRLIGKLGGPCDLAQARAVCPPDSAPRAQCSCS